MSEPRVPCKHCSEDVSIDANKCLSCGAPVLTAEKIQGMMVGVVLVIPILVFTVYSLRPDVITEGPGVGPVLTGVALAIAFLELVLFSMYRSRTRAVERAKSEADTGI